MPQRTFAPPIAKPHNVPFTKGKMEETQSKQEDGTAAKPIKPHLKNSNQKQKMNTAPTVRPLNCRKDGKRTQRREIHFTDAQYEEMFQSVLQKTLQDCMEISGMKGASWEDNEEQSLGRAILRSILQPTARGPLQTIMKQANKPEEWQKCRKHLATSSPSKRRSEGLEAKKKEYPSRKKTGSKDTQPDKGKEKNEKQEADNGGCKENRIGAPKKKVKGNTQVVIDQEEMQEEEKEEEEKSARGSGSRRNTWENKCKKKSLLTKEPQGPVSSTTLFGAAASTTSTAVMVAKKKFMNWCIAWVQCSYLNCQKWRRLPSDVDPSVLPEDWSCNQNSDLQYNSCSVPEETWLGSENEVVYAVYIPGSIVWAKQHGYPWWPGLIESDPDIGEYFLFSSQMDSLPSKYHVTFFGCSVTRAWVSASSLRNFGGANVEENGLAKLKNKGDKKDLETALKMAKEAEQRSIQERIKMFGFLSRFNGRESPKNLKDRVSVSWKPPAKRSRGQPEDKNMNTARLNKSQEKLLPAVPLTKPDGKKKKINRKGDKENKLEAQDATSLPKKSQKEMPLHKVITMAKGSGKEREPLNDPKGLKKSFSVPAYMNAKPKHLSPGTGRSTTPMALSHDANNKDCWDKVKTPLMPGNEDMTDLKDEAMAFDKEDEETFDSHAMSVLAVAQNDCPEDFSLVLFEE